MSQRDRERTHNVLHWKPEKQEESLLHDYFFCPKCDTVSPYKLRRAAIDFTFYFIPLFEIGGHDEYVVCQICKKGFNPKILSPYNQNLFRLVWATKCDLPDCPPEALKVKLLNRGLKEPLVDQLLELAQN